MQSERNWLYASRAAWLGQRRSLVAPDDLQHEQDRAEYQQEDTDESRAAGFEGHADRGQQASDDDCEESAELLDQQDVSVTRLCHHVAPRHLMSGLRSRLPQSSRPCTSVVPGAALAIWRWSFEFSQ